MKKKVENKLEQAMEDFVTVSEAAKLRGVTRAAIHALVNRGRLRSVDMFGRMLLYRGEVLAFEKEKPGPKSQDS